MFKLNPVVAAISLAMIIPNAASALDTGDAPPSYGQATHEVVVGAPQLGEVAPDDNAAFSSATADGDDNGATPDDEDGVFAFPQLVSNAKGYQTNVFVSNPSATDATLVGWVDFDGNGVFDSDEGVSAPVPAGADNLKIKLLWPDNFALSTDYFGPTYARFRVSTDALTVDNATGLLSDGEVEDYTLSILEDSDGDEIPNTEDLDNDNDGIEDTIEGVGIDTDGDGVPNYLDTDSDADNIPDYVEAGPSPFTPQDTDSDGVPDYIDTDSNNDGIDDIVADTTDSDGDGIPDSVEGTVDTDADGIINSEDIDSDNDLLPDGVEAGSGAGVPVDTDGDLIPDYLDLDSDNDGIPDIYESNRNEISIEEVDVNLDGRADATLVFGINGFFDDVETSTDSGIPIYAVPDTDADGVRDFRDIDSDNDGSNDVLEAGSTDADNNGLVDYIVDANGNNIPDTYDVAITGGADTDNDGIDDSFDVSVSGGADQDNDGILDSVDLDLNADGIVDSVVSDQATTVFANGFFSDVDGDFMPDFRDFDADGATDSPTDTNTPVTNTPDPVDTTTNEPTTVDPTASTGIVETGLSGTACSISGRPGNDPMFPGLLLLSSLVMFIRRKSVVTIFKR